MGKLISTVIFALLLTEMSGSGIAQNRFAVEIKRIDAYARSIDRVTNRRAEPDLIFADTADYENGKAKWRRFGSTKSLEKFRETTETYTVAYNWKRKGKIVASNFTLFSPSGDWAKYVDHYFRPAGSLAKLTSELRTFFGDYIIIKTSYFDAKGRRLKRSVKYLDLTSGKPKKPTADILDDDPSFYKVDFFKRTNALPFSHLLRKTTVK